MRLNMRQARSLKDKRRVLRSLKDQIRNNFNVSIAEIGHQNSHQHSAIAFAVVSGDAQFANTVLNKAVDFVRRFPRVDLVDYEIEML